MQDNYTTKGKHLTNNDRRTIERWIKQGKSRREIARLLGKAHQTINNEVKRGLVLQQVKKGLYKKIGHDGLRREGKITLAIKIISVAIRNQKFQSKSSQCTRF